MCSIQGLLCGEKAFFAMLKEKVHWGLEFGTSGTKGIENSDSRWFSVVEALS